MFEMLQSLLDDLIPGQPWKPVSRPALAAWLIVVGAGLLRAGLPWRV